MIAVVCRTGLYVGVAIALALLTDGLSAPVQAQSTSTPQIPGMGYVPAGDFWMGRVRLWMIDEIGWQVRERADDRPVHLVHLDAFFIDTHEVTNADYAEFVKATGRKPPYHWRGPAPPPDRALLPMYNVSWHDASAFCQWKGKRLPTESEWEKAARGGLDREDFPWGMEYQTPIAPTSEAAAPTGAANRAPQPQMKQHAWSNSALGPTKVGSYEANGYGLFDMSGNVWEWTSDWYDLFAYSVAERRNPLGPATGHYKVIRGGGWGEDDARLGSVYIRNFANPELETPTIGFRCVKPAN